MTDLGIRLRQQPDRGDLVDDLADQLDGRVGLGAVLGDLNRRATQVRSIAKAASYAFAWNAGDNKNREWWPQGITTSADADGVDEFERRPVLMVAWYAKTTKGHTRGARLSVVDLADPATPAYRHVLLVAPQRNLDTGAVTMGPVPVHAGGIVWYGRSLLIADTHGGVRVFDVDDVLQVSGHGHDRYRFVLPQRTAYEAVNEKGFEPFKFSFVSLDRTAEHHQLIAGEYGKGGVPTRLVRFGLDPRSRQIAVEDGFAAPLELVSDALEHMQGATVVYGTYYVSTSRGALRRGSLWVRRPGEAFEEFRGALAVGPEDLTYWPQRDQLWSCSEYPGRRYVYAMPRPQFG
ncbi:MAG: hypothetical protein WKF82_11395 [Nocardioidaceae bacterium]